MPLIYGCQYVMTIVFTKYNLITKQKTEQMKKLLSNGSSNAKTKKNDRPTKILYMKPSEVEGKEMCPFATKGCRAACLNTSGMGVFSNVQESRYNRTLMYVRNKKKFLEQIAKEVNGSAKFYARKGKEFAVRLNGTSDQPLVESLIKQEGIHENAVFYDYTKNPKKPGERYLPSGHRYVVALSYSGENKKECIEALKRGAIAAIVFDTKKGDNLPSKWHGFNVVDGDERDDLMLDVPSGTVLGLRAKGKAKNDTSGFVVQVK